MARLVCICTVGADRGSPPSSWRRQRSSALHLIVRDSHSKDKSRESKCSFGFYGPSGETRSRGILVPKKLWELFLRISAPILHLLFRKSCSLKLLSPLSPCAPNPVMVKYVVKTASHKIREAVRSCLCVGVPVSGSIIVSGKQLLAVFLHYGSVECGIIHNIIFVFEKSPPDLPLHFVCNLR